jgi:ABC-type polar amino acid transport system, ATPase component
MTDDMPRAPAETPVLRMENISKIAGGRRILDNVSLSVNRGELFVLIGPSGAGKSSLLQCVNHLLVPDTGSVYLNGTRICPADKRGLSAFRQQVGMIFQDFNLFDHLTALDNVALALRRVKKLDKAAAHERANAELARVGLATRTGLYPAELSGGQKQRVAIARALAMDPIALLLDEPTSALDPELVGEVLAVIRDLAANGMTMIMATHQMDFARALATRIVFMEHGAVIEEGSPADLLAPGAKTRTRDFCAKLGDMDAPGSTEGAPCEEQGTRPNAGATF